MGIAQTTNTITAPVKPILFADILGEMMSGHPMQTYIATSLNMQGTLSEPSEVTKGKTVSEDDEENYIDPESIEATQRQDEPNRLLSLF